MSMDNINTDSEEQNDNENNSPGESGRFAGVSSQLFLGAIFIVVILLLYGFFELVSGHVSSTSTARFVMLLGSGITLGCAILWIGHTVNCFDIPAKVVTAIWATLIVGVLSTSVTVYQQILDSDGPSLKIERLILLDESEVRGDDLPRLIPRMMSSYEKESSQVLFVAVVSGFSLLDSGSMDIRVEPVLFNSGLKLAQIFPAMHFSEPERWRSFQYAKDIESLQTSIGKVGEGETLLVGLLDDFNKDLLEIGSLELRLYVTDKPRNAISMNAVELLFE